ncbi:hypothetical protein [Couchioplanes caeruleus]|uniref:Circularly permuted ATP-grasp superfamily protein n=1 Tax=Couchioplanes caeruleus TaxID=56438 RepID=A0A3N1GM79_9ACTN|nr:hypothetical protein [Couchioplanes caeruleus]ROP31345.1 hypothetical protein EDD30_4244 [Couchioplanes caeruleus]
MWKVQDADALSWFDVPQGSRTDLPAQEISRILREELAGLPRDQRPIPLEPFLLPRAAYAELLEATSSLLALLHKAAFRVGSNRLERMELLSVAQEDCPAFGDDEDFEIRHAADMSRADVVITENGPRFLEFNVGGAFEGLIDFQTHLDGWTRVRERAGQPAFVAVDPFPAFAATIRNACEELGIPPAVVLAGTRLMEGRAAARLHYQRKTAQLRRHGVAAEHYEFADLLRGIGLPGPLTKKLGIFDFTTRDAAAEGYDVSPVWTALSQGFTLVPSQSSWFLHSKKLLALVSEGFPWMTDTERALVDRYVPWTRVLTPGQVIWRDRPRDLPELVIAEQEHMVLKSATGDGGNQVAFGATTTPGAWRAMVAEALTAGKYVVQERVTPKPYPVDVMTAGGTVYHMNATAVVSPFCFGGVPSGCLVKCMQCDEPGVVSLSRGATTSCLLAEA